MATPKACKEHPGWFEIPGYSGYAANRKGEILNKATGHETLGGVSGRYRKVSVYPDDKKQPKLTYTHILVCTAFHGPGKEGQVVLHDDDDRLNNAPANLSWGTQSTNIQSAWDKGLVGSQESLPPSASW